MNATTKEEARATLRTRAQNAATAWVQLIANHSHLTLPLFFSEAMTDLEQAVQDLDDLERATKS